MPFPSDLRLSPRKRTNTYGAKGGARASWPWAGRQHSSPRPGAPPSTCQRATAASLSPPRRSRPATRGVPAHLLRSTARDHGLTGRRRPGSQNPRAARSGGARVKAPVVSLSAHRAPEGGGVPRVIGRGGHDTRRRSLFLSLSPSRSQLPKSQPHLATAPHVTDRSGAHGTEVAPVAVAVAGALF